MCGGVCLFSSYFALLWDASGRQQTAFGPHVGMKPPDNNSAQGVQPRSDGQISPLCHSHRLLIRLTGPPLALLDKKRPYFTDENGLCSVHVFQWSLCSSLCCECSYDRYVSVVWRERRWATASRQEVCIHSKSGNSAHFNSLLCSH